MTQEMTQIIIQSISNTNFNRDQNYSRSFNSYILNSKINKQYKNEIDEEDKKELNEKFGKLLNNVSPNKHSSVKLNRSKTNFEKNNNADNLKTQNISRKISDNRKSLISLGNKKVYKSDAG